MQKVLKDIYQFQVPLPSNPLKELNCFFIKGERNLIVDTGFNTPESYEAMCKSLDELNAPMEETDIFLTHLHSDHTGLVGKLKNDKNQAYISRIDGENVLRSMYDYQYWVAMDQMQIIIGIPDKKRLDVENHPGKANLGEESVTFTYLEEGDTLTVGDYHFQVLDLKGHTPGQLGLYEPEHSILFGGDHILNKITPNITLWDFEQDYLGLYMKNLNKVKKLSVKHLFSSHRQLIEDVNKRIDELLYHHEKRLEAIIGVLGKGAASAYEVAAGIPWDYGGGNFLNFPAEQKWFAGAEVLAHLEHLQRNGRIHVRVDKSGALIYSL